MLETLLNLFENYKKTCPVTGITSGCVTFVRNEGYLDNLVGVDEDAWVITPKDINIKSLANRLKYYPTEFPEYCFTLFHNHINKDVLPVINKAVNAKIHSTVVIGVEGLKVVNTPSNSKIQFIHTGSVEIGTDVEIGPFSVVHRGTMDATIIRKGCKLGAYTNIGHNCDIGRNTVTAAGVIFNGGVKVGKDCWFASGSLIKHYINICDNVVVGLGAVVVKDITKPGIYVGNPARFLKPLEEGWNF